ncbi:WD40 repeat-like protein [Aaosphaeria arxii CBS 175.79]|uniref:WD40 repeat-like protein n=1 Tax=Aaosphaeria arxii CBS 175.79 TaxID=1450172 RepID=A0A6A5Y4C2_9PLEO|nr:WD40 repeat-like protein [Aaosphaeria arxii CBS 175.79]KAF2020425.1 WD40 repeat-like protein [Aaosphaeria arxii CBS 175.79]
MNFNRRPTILSHRPKTSSAADDSRPASGLHEPAMKRTASQTFTPIHPVYDTPLGPVNEDPNAADHAPSLHSHTGSLSRASQAVKKHVRRRFSSSSSSSTRRPSLFDWQDSVTSNTGAAMPAAATFLIARKSSTAEATQQRMQVQHHDSAVNSSSLDLATPVGVQSKFSFRRLGSFRQSRRPATSGPSGEYPRYNPAPAPVPANYPGSCPGQAARAAAAAANNERLTVQKREQEHTRAFLQGALKPSHLSDEVIKDSESGVGMSCSCPITRTDSVQEKKLGRHKHPLAFWRRSLMKKIDPIQFLPAEITTMILANLDAPSLVVAEAVSHAWSEAASSSHVWRSVFLRKFEPEVHVSPSPIMMGGAGVGQFKGGKPAPGQDWKNMYRVRMTINRRWKTQSPAAIYLNGHTDSVYCCQFDEDKIITGSRDRTIRVWDMKSYTCRKVIGGPSNRPVANTPQKLEPHSHWVVDNPSMNGTPAGDDIYHVPEDYHEASILCLQYDDRIMVTGSSDHTCIVWDITGDEYIPITRLRGHSAGVLDVCLDDKHIISCSKDATINVWDRHTHKRLRTLTGHRGPVNAVQLRGNMLVSASGDGVAKLWNLENGTAVMEFPSQDRGLAAVEFSDDAKHILAGGNDHVVYKFNAQTGALQYTSQKHGGLVRSLFLDAHNNRTISGSYDQSIRVADYATGETYGYYENWTTSWILSAKSDYRRVVATSQDGRAIILDFGWRVEGAELLVNNK